MKNDVKIISFANHKGGVGKTTTTASVGSILASQGKQVLVIDLDAQANLTASLLHGESDVSIYNALVGNESLPVVDISPNLHLVPASLGLAMADLELASAMARERILAELIDEVKDNYDYILIDCPPSLGLLTLNAFTASNEIIIPLVAEVLPFKGLTMINNFIDMVRKRLNPKAHVTGILITRWENTNLSKQIEKGMRAQLGELVFQTKIRKNVTIAEAPLESKNIVEYAPRSNGAKDYKAFTEELLKMFGE
ncbi:MAG: ParA family protein [Bacteroidaceae bacterium]|jgi:chromosome partitioning protein|nr:ParA family protein [Bacteroidaceae bacterium]